MEQLIRNEIKAAMTGYSAGMEQGSIWREPLVAFAAADNPEFAALKEIISQDHLLPADILPGAKTVISFFLPFKEDVVKSNIPYNHASLEWALAYIHTNKLITYINERLFQVISDAGFRAGKIPATNNYNRKKMISNWSHRHIAYIARIGTFGINNMLITESGCCGRTGSMVSDWDAALPSVPPLEERCLFKRSNICGTCRTRCVKQAYSESGLNKFLCQQACHENAERYRHLKDDAGCCGKCLVGLPCSSGIPVNI
ncbi:hypothetical protein LJC14_04630 [Treponema sp. OttesenSCG-928-L16]|nr:hypothetical protein [Treponema sp. OttesenSCG-928-L16]